MRKCTLQTVKIVLNLSNEALSESVAPAMAWKINLKIDPSIFYTGAWRNRWAACASHKVTLMNSY